MMNVNDKKNINEEIQYKIKKYKHKIINSSSPELTNIYQKKLQKYHKINKYYINQKT